mmetsp:Transcript_1284/g.2294  ORF Transcript_1284/g.2294 Transcript_1284/m.2294 type:complete len:155 (-) Transcript_1284:13-477(-)
MSDSVRRKRNYPHGIPIDPDEVKDDIATDDASNANNGQGDGYMSDMFVTMCFFARLGFIQPPSCLKCAYRSSGCGGDGKKKNDEKLGGGQNSSSSSSCSELVAWRRDAGILLHPDKLDGNIVFITCDTAKSLVNGDAYPSIRWDTRNKRLLHEM